MLAGGGMLFFIDMTPELQSLEPSHFALGRTGRNVLESSRLVIEPY